jgi:hypothetical protein
MYTQPFTTETPPARLLFALYCQSIFPDIASNAISVPYGVPYAMTNTTPLATVTGPYAMLLFGVAMDHKMVPLCASIATHPPPFVTSLDGRSVKFSLL